MNSFLSVDIYCFGECYGQETKPITFWFSFVNSLTKAPIRTWNYLGWDVVDCVTKHPRSIGNSRVIDYFFEELDHTRVFF